MCSNVQSVRVAFLLCGFISVIAQAADLPPDWGGGWTVDPAVVKRMSEGRSQFNYREELVPSFSLPPLLELSSGDSVSDSRTWETQRRPEIVRLLAESVYGHVPEGLERLSMHLLRADDAAMGGAATAKVVEIRMGVAYRESKMTLKLLLPNERKKPCPLFLLINNRPPENIDLSRKVRTGFWPAEAVIARGYGIAGFQVGDLDPDQHDEFRNGVHGLFGRSIRSHDWGALAAWGWGASRAMDYCEADGDIDASRVALLGHSRGGKAALWAGARDTRFSIVISNNSGCGGAALSRRRFGETVDRINRIFPHWFCGNFERFNGREHQLPLDQHFLLGAIAPRGLYVTSASQDLWADPRGEYLAWFHAGEAFELYGDPPVEVSTPPAPNHPVIRGRRGYHIREGGHGLEEYDWERFMDFAEQLWPNQ